MLKIALNAGHYRYTLGKRCKKSLDPNQTREWVLNDRICDKVEAMLAKYKGYELLRIDDTTGEKDLSLSKRTTKANEWGADIYIAVHHNAGVNGGSGGGIVAYTYTKVSAKTLEWQKALYDALIRRTGLKGNRSKPLATKNLHECRETKMPSVLLELGFMDSSTDVPIILSDEYATQCAEAIVEVIVKKGGLTLKETAASAFVPYKVRITIDSLNYRAGAGTSYKINGTVRKGEVYTIVEEKMNGSTKWGKLKSGAGWISLQYTKKV